MNPQESGRRTRKVYSAREKAQAVLSVWSGRRRPGHVCRDLEIKHGVLVSWEKSGLGGMLKALGAKEEVVLPAPGLELGRRLEKLLVPRGKNESGKTAQEAKDPTQA